MTTATSLADLVTTALMASSTAMLWPGLRSSFDGAWAAARIGGIVAEGCHRDGGRERQNSPTKPARGSDTCTEHHLPVPLMGGRPAFRARRAVVVAPADTSASKAPTAVPTALPTVQIA